MNETRLRDSIALFMTYVPQLKAAGIEYRAHGPDWVELVLPYNPQLVAYPDTGVIASGAIFTLMDSAGGLSVIAARATLAAQATLDLRLDYLRPATPGATIVGRAECYKLTSRVAFVRGIAHDGDPERPIAHMAGTFISTGGSVP